MSLVYYSCPLDTAKGQIDFDTDTFYMMLVTAAYVPNADTNTKRSDVTNEVAGAGYATGGQQVVVASVTRAGDTTSIVFNDVLWDPATISNAAAGVIYKHRGGLASADELVAYLSFAGAPISSSNGPFQVTMANPLQLRVV